MKGINSSPKVKHRKLESVLRALSIDHDEHEERKRTYNAVKQPNGVVMNNSIPLLLVARTYAGRQGSRRWYFMLAKLSVLEAAVIFQLYYYHSLHFHLQLLKYNRRFGSRLGDDMELELSELSDLASEMPDKSEKTTTMEGKLKDEDEMNERHKERGIEKSFFKEQSSPKKDTAKSQDPHTGDFSGDTLGKFYVINDRSAISNVSLSIFRIVWAKAGKSNKFIA